MRAPVLAVTADRRALGPAPDSHRVRPARPETHVSQSVLDAVTAAGGLSVVLPPLEGEDRVNGLVDWTLAHCDGVVITGGAFDIHPGHYGQEVCGRLDRVDEGRTGLELCLARRCMAEDIPVLGLCGGMQVLAVAAGGTLVQDIGAEVQGALAHEQPTDPVEKWHRVRTEHTDLARRYLGAQPFSVNSTHHQAVADPGALEVVGRSPDGVVEAVAHPRLGFCLGVQWHPELLEPTLFERLVAHCLAVRNV
jgi:putative glutamine amidotransferase